MMLKKYYKLIILAAIITFAAVSCKTNQSDVGAEFGEWLIPQDEIRDGGPGKDGIQALENPLFIPSNQVNFTLPTDLVIGVMINGQIKGFPHRILDRHEIANDAIGNTAFVLSYCPLTGSGMVWKAFDGNGNKTFGVSGLLYNSNLILYDRDSDSNWSQMMLKCVNGPKIRSEPEFYYAIETTWETWLQMYPNELVLSDQNGFFGQYDYPYGDYKTSSRLLFPVNNEDNRLHRKERVHGIIVQDKTKAYPISKFSSQIQVLNHTINGKKIVIAGSATKNIATSFESTLPDGTELTFSPIQNALPIIMTDNEGNQWDIFGNALAGPRTNSTLTPTLSFNAYWFAWAAFYPNAELF